MMRRKASYKKVYTYLFLLLFIGYYGSVTFFNHTHLINESNSITHSHPFKSDNAGAPMHSHPEKGYITIQLLSILFVSLVIVFPNWGAISRYATKLGDITCIFQVIPSIHYDYLLRGPPVN